MAETKEILTTYFKRWQMHVIFFVSVDKKMISTHNEGILEIFWFVHMFLQN